MSDIFLFAHGCAVTMLVAAGVYLLLRTSEDSPTEDASDAKPFHRTSVNGSEVRQKQDSLQHRELPEKVIS